MGGKPRRKLVNNRLDVGPIRFTWATGKPAVLIGSLNDPRWTGELDGETGRAVADLLDRHIKLAEVLAGLSGNHFGPDVVYTLKAILAGMAARPPR